MIIVFYIIRPLPLELNVAIFGRQWQRLRKMLRIYKLTHVQEHIQFLTAIVYCNPA